jgi:uncharacterized membrane protein YhhN
MLKKYGLGLFWIILLADCYFIYAQQDALRWFTKPLLLTTLLVYFNFNVSRRHHSTSKVLANMAMLLALAGDVLLLYVGDQFFIAGLVCFLIAHIILTAYFSKLHPLNLKKSEYFFGALLPLLVIAGLSIRFIYPYLNHLEIPVIIYSMVIVLMTATAANVIANKKTSTLGIKYFLPGALLLVLSDLTLALNKFYFSSEEGFHILNIVVMLTYGYGFSILTKGFVTHLKK